MKTTALFLLAIIINWSCNTSSGNNKVSAVAPEDDSLQYYPPTPAKLDKQEFRRYYRTLSQFFNDELLRRGFNGGILVAKEGTIIYESYAGYADLRTKALMTDTTMMHIASSGKTFTGMATLSLAREGKLSLNDSLQKYFPGLPYHCITV